MWLYSKETTRFKRTSLWEFQDSTSSGSLSSQKNPTLLAPSSHMYECGVPQAVPPHWKPPLWVPILNQDVSSFKEGIMLFKCLGIPHSTHLGQFMENIHESRDIFYFSLGHDSRGAGCPWTSLLEPLLKLPINPQQGFSAMTSFWLSWAYTLEGCPHWPETSGQVQEVCFARLHLEQWVEAAAVLLASPFLQRCAVRAFEAQVRFEAQY